MRCWLLGLVLIPLQAQDWGGLHLFNADIPLDKRWTLQLHTRARTNQHFSHLFQSRGGPILTYAVQPKLTLIAGYYALNEENGQNSDRTFHRYWGGFLTTPIQNRRLSLETRTLLERFENAPSGDYLRVRQRLLAVIGRKTWRPYLQAEGLTAQGHWIGRWTAGTQWRPEGRNFFAIFGYEYRMNPNGSYMHLIATTWQFQLRRAKH